MLLGWKHRGSGCSEDASWLAAVFYTDDVLLMSTCPKDLERTVSALMAAWTMAAAAEQYASGRTITETDNMEDVDVLEPDPKNHCKALQHP